MLDFISSMTIWIQHILLFRIDHIQMGLFTIGNHSTYAVYSWSCTLHVSVCASLVGAFWLAFHHCSRFGAVVIRNSTFRFCYSLFRFCYSSSGFCTHCSRTSCGPLVFRASLLPHKEQRQLFKLRGSYLWVRRTNLMVAFASRPIEISV